MALAVPLSLHCLYWSKDSVETVEIVEELPSPETSVRYFSKFETGCAVELCSRLLAHT